MIIGPEKEVAFTDTLLAMVPRVGQVPQPLTIAQITARAGWTNRAIRNNVYVLEELAWAERIADIFPMRFFLTFEGLNEALERRIQRNVRYTNSQQRLHADAAGD